MSQDDLSNAFSFVNGPEDEPLSQKQPRRAWLSAWKIGFVGVLFHAVLFAAFLNFMGIIRIPKLEGFTRERLLPGQAAPDPIPVARPMPPGVVPPGVTPNFPRTGTPPRELSGGGRPTGPRPARTPETVASGKQGQKSQDQRPPLSVARRSDAEAPPAAGVDPAALLESKGVVRGPSGFVLPSESDALAKLVDLRARAEEFNVALARVNVLQRLSELDGLVTEANANIAELNFQMGQFPLTWFRNRWVHGNNMDDENTFQTLKAQHDELVRTKNTALVPERDNLRRVPGLIPVKAAEVFKIKSEAALYALKDVREAISKTTTGYGQLANDPEVGQARLKLGQPQLGPSAAFQAAIKEFGRFEKSIGLKPTFTPQKASSPNRPKRQVAPMKKQG